MDAVRNRARDRAAVVAIGAALAAATWVVYAPVLRFGYLLYDDPGYVTRNEHVRSGLGMDGLLWALTSNAQGNWHPLTWLSHMLDQELFGPGAAGAHATSIALHAAAAVALFLALRRLTGALWKSALVAALFALHPLHVESVAWISERKDALSGLLFALTLLAWAWHRERPAAPRYAAALALFALGLTAKPMLVTLPFVLLLLDFWPLRRPEAGGRLLLEKAPFFLLALASSIATYLVQAAGGAVRSFDAYPAGLRLGNALVAYVTYLRRTVWPSDLAYFYPYPSRIPWWQIGGAVALLAALSLLAFRARRSRPYVAVGWLWFLGTLVPVIGIVQAGAQSLANRYTYLPLIGLFIALAWTLGDLTTGRRERVRWAAAAAAAAVVACGVAASREARFWRSDAALATRALEVTTDNYHANDTLGAALAREGRIDEAAARFVEALRIRPEMVSARVNLGMVLAERGRFAEAIAQYEEALRHAPDASEALNNLGIALARVGRLDEAVSRFRRALEIDPGSTETYANLALVESSRRRDHEAARQFEEYLRREPGDADANRTLADIRVRLGEEADAVVHYSAALRLRPGLPAAARGLAWVKATSPRTELRDGAEALRLAGIANRADPEDAGAIGALAAALAESGRFEEAVTTSDRAIDAARSGGEPELADALSRYREDYLADLPVRTGGPDAPAEPPHTEYGTAESSR